jgi:hypothetical protein
MSKKLFLSAIALAILAGCASTQEAAVVPPANPPPVVVTPSAPDQSKPVSIEKVVVSLKRDQPRQPANGGSAVVLLRSSPPSSYENLAVCRALKNYFPTAKPDQIAVGLGRGPDGAIKAFRPIYWLAKGDTPFERGDCANLVLQYDFDRADVIRKKYNLAGTGPSLLVVRADETQAAALDLANRSASDIGKFVQLFGKGLAFEKDVWDPSVTPPEKQRELVQSTFGNEFRDALMAAFAFVASPAAQAGCRLGDVKDLACE